MADRGAPFRHPSLPDHASATAAALAVNRSSAASVKTTVLIAAEEVDKATKKLGDRRPPGK